MDVHQRGAYAESMVGERLSLTRLRRVNEARLKRWHPVGSWSVSDWAVAMAGEAGEVCNAVKKLNRIRDGISNISTHSKQVNTEAESVAEIAEEIADTVLYLDLLALRLGIDLADAVAKKFNTTSVKYGFPERL